MRSTVDSAGRAGRTSRLHGERPRVPLARRVARLTPWLVLAAAAHLVLFGVSSVTVVSHRATLMKGERASLLTLGSDWGGDVTPVETPVIDRNAIPRADVGSEGLPALDLVREGVPEGETIGGMYGNGTASAFVSLGAGRSGGGGRALRGQAGGTAPSRGSARAPAETWKRSSLAPNTTRLRVGDRETLPLDGVEAAIRIEGSRARVVLDCLFRNDRDATLEGTFELRLPNDASPFYFAFGESVAAAASGKPGAPADVAGLFLGTAAATASATSAEGIGAARTSSWSAPKEARMVPREKAAFAYTQTVRRRVDPALVEWSGAGVFSSRVFPLTPHRVHRVVFAYDVDLAQAGDDRELRFDLPPGVPERSVTLSVAAGESVRLTPSAVPDVEGGRALYSLRNPADDAVTIRIANPGDVMLSGDDPAAGPCFAMSFRPELPASERTAGAERAVFLVDTSLTSRAERFPVWLALVSGILEKNRGTLREFAVLWFDVQTSWWRERWTANTAENAAALLADAGALSLEGATDLRSALAEASSPAWVRAARHRDLFLLSDGAATWGETDPSELAAALATSRGCPLWAYQTGLAGTDSTMLAHLARESGGAVFSVTGESEIAAAATAHRDRPFQIRRVSVEGASDVLLAGRPSAAHAGQTLRVAGRGAPRDGASVVLDLERDGRPFRVVAKAARVERTDLAPRAYGQIAVAQLEEWGEAAGREARAYATHFRVVGSTCSLLMLDGEADYARFGIRPEEEAAAVRSTRASEAVARCAESRRRETADRRAELLAWLRRLETAPGVGMGLSGAALRAIGSMPESSFGRRAPVLRCASLAAADVPPHVAERLGRGDADYDVVTDEASRRRACRASADALRILSSLVEAQPGDMVLARDVAYDAMELGEPAQAARLLRRVVRQRPFEPETYRALAEACAAAGDADEAIVWSEAALAGSFEDRFGDFRKVAALDYLRLLRRIERREVKTSVPDFAAARLAEVQRETGGVDPSLVVVVTWNTDRTDVDLHVTDPAGEECSYQNPRTKIGGNLTRDVTRGYGPEMFTIANPRPGDYVLSVHYFASDAMRVSGRSRVLATVYERWGRPDERVTRRAITLTTSRAQAETVGVVRVAAR